MPKEEKLQDQEFRKMFGSSFEEILEENPLLDSFELTLTSASADKELLDSFIAAVGRIDGVDNVSYPAMIVERLHTTVGKIRLVLLLFGGALLLVSLILLSNTIRLAIFSKRYLINTMKLVGATRWFIMRPFLGSSFTQGVIAGNPLRNRRLGALRTGRVRAQRGRPGAYLPGRNSENRRHHRVDDPRRSPHLGVLHAARAEQIRQHEIEQDLSLLSI